MNAPCPEATAGFRRRMPSKLEEVDAACLQLREFCRTQGWEESAFGIELVVRECLNNAILHGNGRDPGKLVSLEMVCRPPWLRLQVTDQGNGFDWRSRMGRGLPDDDKPCGRGLLIADAYTRRVRFNPSGNQITLWFQQGPSSHRNRATYDR